MNSSVHCLEPRALEHFLERRRRTDASLSSETGLADHLVEVLYRANEFVPSDAGSILLDDPATKRAAGLAARLTFIAAFGVKASQLVGQEISAEDGIAGHVYQTGISYHTSDANQDDLFYPVIDQLTQFRTESLVGIPIRIGDAVCGVLELIRTQPYRDADLRLLGIFAGYISTSIQNVLDARHAQAIAKRDNLTRLFNDRYLHIMLSESISRCLHSGSDLTTLFLDLDFFKRVNDTHGHLAGSEVLREVGGLLAAATAEQGIVARYGGDEFVIVLPDHDLSAGIDLAENIRSEIAQATFCTEPGSLQPEPCFITGVTCSIGAASLHRHTEGSDPDRVKTTLLHLADAAMYVAKETGRNRSAIAGEPVPRRIPLQRQRPTPRIPVDSAEPGSSS